jgi:hypothetical protein
VKFYLGQTKNPMRLVTKVPGYRFKDHDAPETYIERPSEITRPVRRLFGLSIGQTFFGVMICNQPESN